MPAAEVAATPLVVDWRELQRWGLSADRLPPNTEVLFRTPSAWERYRLTILATLGVLLLQSGLLVVLLLERRERRRTRAALREIEARAAEQRSELTHLGRVALVGELSATLAHEMKQPLGAILANARVARHMLERDQINMAELREILEDIAADDRRAGAVIDHVRSLVKKEDPERELLSVNDVVREVMDLMRSELQHRGVIASIRLSEPAPMVLADRVELQQVLVNLVINASDAMGERRRGERLLVISTAGDGDARIEVQDQGTGIPNDTLSSIFDPFVTTKRDGLGLGLAICRTIITEHHGRMWPVNNPDRGATMIVSLPLASAVPAPATEPTTAVPLRTR